ncbi:RidA family protein [Halostagnicola sp. A-GB9-2]|uniref:RidA family protein n=1 Tax=Halostagnicola sp. A-GB9-2 TaxID=3048066 RepID=UPI0024C0C304|nr:RidA family protein [Halostagnicola sp. A-GB9-2]MDJ1434755.1 RidA family protein [Halostagnicola sp. A-GB9-2]
MKKTASNPETGDWAEHDVAYSDGVAIEAPTHTRVLVSGIISGEPGLEAQTRDVLDNIADIVAEFGGSMKDVVRVRVYIKEPYMNEEALETVHDVRHEFFVREHYPASTLVEVNALVDETSVIEIDADAIIPDTEWETEAI